MVDELFNTHLLFWYVYHFLCIHPVHPTFIIYLNNLFVINIQPMKSKAGIADLILLYGDVHLRVSENTQWFRLNSLSTSVFVQVNKFYMGVHTKWIVKMQKLWVRIFPWILVFDFIAFSCASSSDNTHLVPKKSMPIRVIILCEAS